MIRKPLTNVNGHVADLPAGDGLSVDDSLVVTESTHKYLRDLAHLADGSGPYWLSGAYREILPAGDPFPTLIIWWTDSSKTTKIFAKLITYTPSKLPSTIRWSAYAADGTTVVAQTTDTIVYSAVFEINRTRVVM